MIDRYDIGPVGVRLAWRAAELAPVAELLSGYLYGNGAGAPRVDDLALTVELTDRLEESRGAPLLRYNNDLELERRDGEVILRHEVGLARLRVGEGLGEVAVLKRALDSRAHLGTAYAVVLESIVLLLRDRGLYGMHAATLAREGRGVLIPAVADSGKSTLAFRLVQSGWDYLSDDTVLLRRRPAHVEVLGLRSHFGLDADMEEVFPEIGRGREASLLKEEKWAVNIEAIFPGRRGARCVPHALLFPTIVDADLSALHPVGAGEALRVLVEQSALSRVDIPGAREHFEALAWIAREVPAYRLRSGRDLLRDPGRASSLLTPLLSGMEA
jgi:hypothetical protein